jgi:hypothetical protein
MPSERKIMRVLTSARSAFLAAATLLGSLSPTLHAQYTVVDLGPAGTTSFGNGAGAGQQVGFTAANSSTTITGANQAALWSGSSGTLINLHPATAITSQANAASNGQQVGSVDSDAVLWNGTADSTTILTPAGFVSAQAFAIGDGQQVGCGSFLVKGARGVLQPGPNHALLWQGTASSAIDLNTSSGFDSSCAFGVSGGNQVGTGTKGPNSLAVLWLGTGKSATSLHPDKGFLQSGGTAISGTQQVGWGLTAAFIEPGVVRLPISRFHALLWTGNKATVVDLHPVGGPFKDTQALGVGGGKQVGVGFDSRDGGSAQTALLWSGSAASAVSLNQFLPPGFVGARATAIDPTTGIITGSATTSQLDPSAWHAVIWVPVAPAAAR